MKIEFGKTADDYAVHRQGFPESFFRAMKEKKYIQSGDRLLDLGTGTGTLARGFAKQGCDVIGLDPSETLLEQARLLARDDSPIPRFAQGYAEKTGFSNAEFDVVTAGQCWHWFDGARAATEVSRILRSGGRVVIPHFDWLPLKGNIVSETESLILKHNPCWNMAGGAGIYPEWLGHLGEAGFTGLELHSYDEGAYYSPEAWRGRIRASAGVGASLSRSEVDLFDGDLAQMLSTKFPQTKLSIPHRVSFVTGTK